MNIDKIFFRSRSQGGLAFTEVIIQVDGKNTISPQKVRTDGRFYIISEILKLLGENFPNSNSFNIREVLFESGDPRITELFDKIVNDELSRDIIHIDEFIINTIPSIQKYLFISEDIVNRIKFYVTNDVQLVSIGGISSIHIYGFGLLNSDNKISSLEISPVLTEKSWLKALFIDSMEIQNIDIEASSQSSPGYAKLIDIIYIVSSKIDNLNLSEHDSLTMSISKFHVIKSMVRGGYLNNISFQSIYFSLSRINQVLFSGVDFPQDPEQFIIESTIFQSNSFLNVNWGNYFSERGFIYHKTDNAGNREYYVLKNNQIKENYRMLKNEYDSIGNKTEANKFFAKEMEYHMKTLKESGSGKDYWIARLQKEISGFGNDWVRAFTWYIIFTLGCYGIYSCYNFIVSDFIISWSQERMLNEFEVLTKALNPIPKVEDITNPLLLLFSLIKILIVYQIVVALRRISQR